jgi:hypothetical protein
VCFLQAREPRLAASFALTPALRGESHWVEVSEHSRSVTEPRADRPRILLLHGCAGNAMAPFLERKRQVDSSGVLIKRGS